MQTAPTAKLRLAVLGHLFVWLVIGHVIEVNPAHAVHGPAHRVKIGKTPELELEEARALLDNIDVTMQVSLCDRALMVYSFARVGAALAMRCGVNRPLLAER